MGAVGRTPATRPAIPTGQRGSTRRRVPSCGQRVQECNPRVTSYTPRVTSCVSTYTRNLPAGTRPQRTSVAIDPSEVLHQSGVAMVDGALGPLTAAEARDFNAIVGEFGASHGGI